MVLTIKSDFLSIFGSIKNFLIQIWQSIEGFFLKYMSEQTFNIVLLALIIIIVLFVIIAIMNRN